MDWKLLLQIAGTALGLLYLWLEYRADIRLWIGGEAVPERHRAVGEAYQQPVDRRMQPCIGDCQQGCFVERKSLFGQSVLLDVSRNLVAQGLGRDILPQDQPV